MTLSPKSSQIWNQFFSKPYPIQIITYEGFQKEIDQGWLIGAMRQRKKKDGEKREWDLHTAQNKEIWVIIHFFPINDNWIQMNMLSLQLMAFCSNLDLNMEHLRMLWYNSKKNCFANTAILFIGMFGTTIKHQACNLHFKPDLWTWTIHPHYTWMIFQSQGTNWFLWIKFWQILVRVNDNDIILYQWKLKIVALFDEH